MNLQALPDLAIVTWNLITLAPRVERQQQFHYSQRHRTRTSSRNAHTSYKSNLNCYCYYLLHFYPLKTILQLKFACLFKNDRNKLPFAKENSNAMLTGLPAKQFTNTFFQKSLARPRICGFCLKSSELHFIQQCL